MENLGIHYDKLDQQGIRFIVAPELADTALTGFGIKHGAIEAERDDNVRASVEPDESGLSD